MKKILILAPILYNWDEVVEIQKSVKHIQGKYTIDYLDPVGLEYEVYGAYTSDIFFKLWQKKIAEIKDYYDIFMGFSFGGVILCQCLSIINNKKIILISTPTNPSSVLRYKLQSILDILKTKHIGKAIELHNNYVFAPFNNPVLNIEHKYNETNVNRLINGYSLLLQANLIPNLANANVKTSTINLIGNNSNLVGIADVFFNDNHQIYKIPHSSMRVLQNNPNYCFKIIEDYINDKKILL